MENIEVNLKVTCKNDNDVFGIKKDAVYACSSNNNMTQFTVKVPGELGENPRLIFFSEDDLNKYFEVATKVYVPSFMLDDKALEEAYREKHFQYVREDVSSVLNSGVYAYLYDEYSDEEIEALIDNVANAYVFNGDYDCNVSYWDNIGALIDEYILQQNEAEWEETVEME